MAQYDGILGNVVGAVFGSNPRGGRHNELGATLAELGDGTAFRSGLMLHAALRLVAGCGGLDGLLSRLREHGLGDRGDSWVSTGPNLPVSPAELQKVCGTQVVDEVAAPLHLSADEAGTAMARVLPELIDQFTPQGELPANHAEILARARTMLAGAGA